MPGDVNAMFVIVPNDLTKPAIGLFGTREDAIRTGGPEEHYTIKTAGELPGDYPREGKEEVVAFIERTAHDVHTTYGYTDSSDWVRALRQAFFGKYGFQGFDVLVRAACGHCEVPSEPPAS